MIMPSAPAPPHPRITAISTAVPGGEIDGLYREWAAAQTSDQRQRKLFDRMSARSGIASRFTVLDASEARFSGGGFYGRDGMPGTAERMAVYARTAPALTLEAIAGLPDCSDVTHIVLASCTGFLAPGLDQIIARRLGLATNVERVSIGFMGCYAGVTALRTAAHIVRSDCGAKVLVLAVELCTLHLQQTDDLEALLAMGQFADGAAAALVSAHGQGMSLGAGISAQLEDSEELIRWTIGDSGFVMHLSGAVPGRIADALERQDIASHICKGEPPGDLAAWAVHPGGKSILDAVERGLELPEGRLDASRAVLNDFGNMSSATVLFVIERLMASRPAKGVALAFGPGLAMEGIRLGWTGDAG